MLYNFYIKDAVSEEPVALANVVFHYTDRSDYPVMAGSDGLVSVFLSPAPSSLTISSAGYKTTDLGFSSVVGAESVSIRRNEITLPGVVVTSGKKEKKNLLLIAALLLLTQVK